MRRRRTRGTWFPNIGTVNDGAEDNFSGREFTVNIPDQLQQVGVIPITFDVPFEGDNIDPTIDSLSDIVGSEYVLQRLVGKLHIERRTAVSALGQDRNPAVLVGCGFFVARANDQGSGGGFDTPIGSATPAERRDNYSPLEQDTIREPWIWRRTWILGAGPTNDRGSGNGGVAQPSARAYPPSTAFYGSVADGAHFDSKVKRRVNQDNRLWFAIAAATFPIGTAPVLVDELQVVGYLDHRIFGSLRKARGTSAF